MNGAHALVVQGCKESGNTANVACTRVGLHHGRVKTNLAFRLREGFQRLRIELRSCQKGEKEGKKNLQVDFPSLLEAPRSAVGADEEVHGRGSGNKAPALQLVEPPLQL